MTTNKKKLLCGKHTWGFFSCCTVKLSKILNFVNEHNECPDLVCDGRLFLEYKEKPSDPSINEIFFIVPEYKPNLTKEDTFTFFIKGKNGTANRTPYKTIDFTKVSPWIKHYFTPSVAVKKKIEILDSKYGFSQQKICTVFYRGLDKRKECITGSYDAYLSKAQETLNNNPNIMFYVQTDEQEFLDTFKSTYKNSFSCQETTALPQSSWTGQSFLLATKYMPQKDKINYAIDFLALIQLMSKSHTIITHSGNCGLWTAFYRNNTENFHQFLNDHWE